MRSIFIALLLLSSISVRAQESDILDRALNCKLADRDLPMLKEELERQMPAFRKPAGVYALPTANSYRLVIPASAFGFTSTEVVLAPGRIVLAVPRRTVEEAASSLNLEEMPYSPAYRTVRPTVSIVAYRLSHPALAGKLLIGCEYANQGAAMWAE